MTNKVELNELTQVVHKEQAFLVALNENFLRLQQAINDTISRSGKEPNEMQDVLDMNGNRITNVADAVDDTDAVTRKFISGLITQIDEAIARLSTLTDQAMQAIQLYAEETIYPVLNQAVSDARGYASDARDYRDSAKDYRDATQDLYNQLLGLVTNLNTLLAIGDDLANIDAVAGDLTNIDAVAGSISNVNAVAGDLAKIIAVADDLTKINNVADDLTNIDNVADDLTNINSVAGDLTNINSVAGDLTNIDSVAGDLTNIDALAAIASDITTVVNNLTAILAAPTYAANAQTWAEGTDQAVTVLGGTHSAKRWAELSQADVAGEATLRYNADQALQQQIDAITAGSDVRDIVGTYADLQAYDTTTLNNNDVIKVITDSTHDNASSYYKWVITDNVGAWNYIGSEGPYLTPSAAASTYVPQTRTINSKALSADITLTPSDIGAATSSQGAKADTAVQPSNLKTINGTSLIGAGNIVIDTDIELSDIAEEGSNISFTQGLNTDNYVVTGTLTISSDEKASGFSSSNYITAKDFTFNPGTTPWMLAIDITTPASFTADMCIFSTDGLSLSILSDGTLQANLTGSSAIGTLDELDVDVSSSYTVVVQFTGTEYRYFRKAGSVVSVFYLESSEGILGGVPKLGIETDTTDPFLGTIDLANTYITVDNTEVWRAAVVNNRTVITATVPTQPSDIGAATAAQGAKADTALQNTATGTNSLSIEGASSSLQSATNVGKNSQASNNWTTALGQSAKATGESAIAIGSSTTASGKKSIAIGNSASVSGIGTIQLGRGTTTDNGCFYVGLTENGTTHNNYKVLDATGKIPNDRLTISTSMSSSSTDSQIPSLKLLFDTCGDIETLINAL